MALSEKKRQSNDKWIRENYKQVKLSMPKDEAEQLDGYCSSRNISKAGFIRAAIKEKMEREAVPEPSPKPVEPRTPVCGSAEWIEQTRAQIEAERAAGAQQTEGVPSTETVAQAAGDGDSTGAGAISIFNGGGDSSTSNRRCISHPEPELSPADSSEDKAFLPF